MKSTNEKKSTILLDDTTKQKNKAQMRVAWRNKRRYTMGYWESAVRSK